jgi:plastocyanin
MKLSLPGTFVLLAAILAGCAGAPADTSSAVPTTTVDLPRSYRFEPSAIEVDVGATVTWTNHDEFTHNVAFDGADALVMKPGESVIRTFPDAGTFAYLCSLHPREMQGSVAVVGGR